MVRENVLLPEIQETLVAPQSTRMGPIKIKIATTQIEGASEYDAPKEKEAAKATPASEYDSPPAATESRTEAPATEAGSCYRSEGCLAFSTFSRYRYEGSECLYTEPASGATYRWDVQQAAWVNRETGEARPAGQAAAQVNRYFGIFTLVFVFSNTGLNSNVCGLRPARRTTSMMARVITTWTV
jgi:hypothetical protein